MFIPIRFLLKMKTIEIKRQVADSRNKTLRRKKRDHLVEKLEKTQSQRIQNLKAFLNSFDFDQVSNTKN